MEIIYVVDGHIALIIMILKSFAILITGDKYKIISYKITYMLK